MKKFLHSIFDQFSSLEILDVRPFNHDISELPGFPNIKICTKSEFKRLKSNGFNDPVGKAIMERIYRLDKLKLSKKPLVLMDQGKLLIAKTVWLHFQPNYEIYIYHGGINALLREAQEFFKQKFNFIVLYGKTGSGKTEVLENLEEKGAQALNLERIARHKGSGFGNLRDNKQPSQEEFDLQITFSLARFDPKRPIFVEAESFSLGKNLLPLNLMENVSSGKRIWLDPPKEIRVKRIVKEYFGVRDERIKEEIARLRNKLGHDKAEELITNLEKKAYALVAEGLIDYFDQGESYQMEDNDRYAEIIGEVDPEKIAATLKTKYP
ncbi:hypothetical protein [Algoriphagus sediminis]|uniref:tRNA 2-selenouridine synthase AAA domain-containing protein n=1 Tax=Algoriphagus sediminis TaxID=3057113 RepID=A0ABT7Y9C6_9BACT|nr:hypothetical protein [Algoriphagus sediminis]MDN3203122.1 hypothetical protein [Algoriphagus sediminis]